MKCTLAFIVTFCCCTMFWPWSGLCFPPSLIVVFLTDCHILSLPRRSPVTCHPGDGVLPRLHGHLCQRPPAGLRRGSRQTQQYQESFLSSLLPPRNPPRSTAPVQKVTLINSSVTFGSVPQWPLPGTFWNERYIWEWRGRGGFEKWQEDEIEVDGYSHFCRLSQISLF